jgi:hypothetical protein
MVADTVQVSQIPDVNNFGAAILLVDPEQEVRISRKHTWAVAITNDQSSRSLSHVTSSLGMKKVLLSITVVVQFRGFRGICKALQQLCEQ